MSETELDLVSIATRVLQLEEEQVILKKGKYLPLVKHGIGEVADSRVGCRERLDSDRGCH